MLPRTFLALVAAGTITLSSWHCPCLARSQPSQSGNPLGVTGILTDELSHAHLRTWQSILEIVMAKDKAGRSLHPTLYDLYSQAENSGHLIRIELSEEESLSRAGQFIIEKADPRGLHHKVRIRLNLATIRRTYVGANRNYANGLMPFAGLNTKLRYAEVLGHELAHAVGAFQNSELWQLDLLLEQESADLDKCDLNHPNGDLLERIERIKRLQHQVEEPAEAAELQVWRELSRTR